MKHLDATNGKGNQKIKHMASHPEFIGNKERKNAIKSI